MKLPCITALASKQCDLNKAAMIQGILEKTLWITTK